jgi:CheY-like chemotaxis protein
MIMQATLKKILLVEDDEDIQAIITVALEVVGGLTLKSCSSGREAQKIASDFQPDMILLDVMMPDMDGPSTLLALRKIPSLSNTPCIFVTAKTQAYEISHYISLGALTVITKPFDPMTLASHLQQLWKQYHER